MQDISVTQRLRAYAITFVTPVAWRRFENRQTAALRKFSRAEYDSGWQALRVLPTQRDPALRAELFVTALEEFRHSALFKTLLAGRKVRPAESDMPQRQSIWDETPEIGHFLAAQYVGETSVHSEFSIYEKAAGDRAIAMTFRDICADEEKHGRNAYENLVAAVGSDGRARALIRKVRRSHDWRAVSTALKPIGDVVSNIFLLMLYFVLGLFLWPLARRRLLRS